VIRHLRIVKSHEEWPEYGIGDAPPGTVSFPVWRCSECKTVNDALRPECACGARKRCDHCGSPDTRLYPQGTRCEAHVSTMPPPAHSLSEARGEPEASEPRAPYPAPEIPARAADLSVVRRGPKSFIKLVDAVEGVTIDGYEAYEARGACPDANGDPGEVVDSLSVRVVSPRGRLALVWISGTLKIRLAWTPDRGTFPITLDQAKDFLQGKEIQYVPKKKPVSKPRASTKFKDGMR
jgi:hypothetical protein